MNKNLLKEGLLSFFFLGRAPIAPGTFGTIGGLILAYMVINFFEDISGYLLLVLVFVMYYFGLILAPWAEKNYGEDPGVYVIDEVIGYLVVILFLNLFLIPIEMSHWIVSFILFRIFDVLKLWPAKNLEELKGGHGILMDDIAAGFQTLICVIFLDVYDFI